MSDHTQAIMDVLSRLESAWNHSDGAAYGAEFTEDASYVTFAGTRYVGSEEIGRTHQALFHGLLRGTTLRHEVLDIRFAGDSTAVVVTRGATSKSGKPGRMDKVQSYTLVRSGDGWKVAAFQNTKRRPLLEALSFRMEPGSRPAA